MIAEDKMKLPQANGDNYRATYENYEVACPICGKWNVLNRRTDIGSIGAACGKPVKCLHCKEDFLIIDDKVDEKYEYFLNDCAKLIEEKKYMFCIIFLCQACEAFLMKCIDIKLLWEPYRRGVFGTDNKGRSIFDEYRVSIQKAFKELSYQRLLNVFFDLYLYGKQFNERDEISNYVKNPRKLPKDEPCNDEILEKSNGIQRDVFLELKKLRINEMRNDVAHKDGYRPSLKDVAVSFEKVREIMKKTEVAFNLTNMLFYCRNSNMMELVGE